MSDNNDEPIGIQLNIDDAPSAMQIVLMPYEDEAGKHIRVGARGFEPSDRGAQAVAEVLKAASEGILAELGVESDMTIALDTSSRCCCGTVGGKRVQDDNCPTHGTSFEAVASRRRLGETVRDVEKRERKYGENELDSRGGIPYDGPKRRESSVGPILSDERLAEKSKPRPRFNPKPRGGQ